MLFYISLPLLLILAIWLGESIPVADQVLVADTLKSTAAVLFGVIGAWIALTYPKALDSLLRRDASSRDPAPATVSRLLLALRYATIVLLLLIPFEVIYIVLRNQAWAYRWQTEFRITAFFSLSVLALLEVKALILTLTPMELLRDEVEQLRRNVSYTEQMFRQVKKVLGKSGAESQEHESAAPPDPDHEK